MIASFVVLALLVNCPLSMAQVNQAETATSNPNKVQQVVRLTKELILRLIELERFSLHYRLENDKQPKARTYRFFAAHEANSLLETAANIILTTQAAKKLEHKRVSRPAIENAYVLTTVGNSVAGWGSFQEFLSDMVRDSRNRKSGFDSRAAFKHLEKSIEDIDRLMLERDLLIEEIHVSETSQLYEVLKEERNCLKDIRRHCLNEFIQFHQNMIAHRINKDVFYLANTATNAVFLAADCVFLRAFSHDRNKKFIGTGQIVFLCGTPLTIFSPYIAQWASKIAVSRAKKRMQRFLLAESMEAPNIEGHVARTKDLCTSLPAEKLALLGPLLERLDLYLKANQAAERVMSSEREHLAHLQKVAHESLVIAPVLGGAQVARGTLESLAYYGYGHRPSRSNVHTAAALTLGATVTSIAANAFAAGYTGKNFVETKLYERRLHKKGQLVEDVIGARLAELEDIEKRARAL